MYNNNKVYISINFCRLLHQIADGTPRRAGQSASTSETRNASKLIRVYVFFYPKKCVSDSKLGASFIRSSEWVPGPCSPPFLSLFLAVRILIQIYARSLSSLDFEYRIQIKLEFVSKFSSLNIQKPSKNAFSSDLLLVNTNVGTLGCLLKPLRGLES